MMFHAKTQRRKERLKRRLRQPFILILLTLLAGCARAPHPVPEWTRPPVIDVVYPRVERPDTVVSLPRVDSTFTFGSVQPSGSRLWVNGFPVRVWPNGAFLAYIPFDSLTPKFIFKAVSPSGDTASTWLHYRLPTPAPEGLVSPVHPLNRQLPARITIVEDFAAARCAPNQAYILFPPRGTVALADSFAQGCYRIRLLDGQYAWIEEKFVNLDTCSRDIPAVSVSKIAVQANAKDGEWTVVRIPLTQPILFHLEEKPESPALILDLYGATSRLNRMDYDPADSLVREIRWNQIGNETLRLEFFLNTSRLWGYSAAWQTDSSRGTYGLTLKIRRPPRIERRPLKGRVIVLDPGHGGSQPGSVGPTRLAEKEPNLKLAVKLKTLLEKEGARVHLTRATDSTVDLYDRVDFAIAHEAEILLSLHHNALSDGENPFVKHGSGVYYYQPQSLDLARTLHDYLVRGTGLQDNGLYYQNLALCRPTEMPAVLIESAFMMYPEEEMLLRDDRFLERTAAGLADGLKEYFNRCQKEQSP
jgi:N-acetylmuramoyl-L-alanine amidase